MFYILALASFFSYFLESVFGFGGTILFIGSSGFFVEMKPLIYLSMYVSSLASVFILLSDHAQFSWAHYRRIMIMSLPFVVLGTLAIDYLRSEWLFKGFAVILIAFAVQGLCFSKIALPELFKKTMVFLGGLVQGVYSTGGPFLLMGYKDNFANKSELRTTMAGFFLTANLLRIVQTSLTTDAFVREFVEYWWLVFPVMIGVFLGHRVHLALDERSYKIGILVLALVAGVVFLFK